MMMANNYCVCCGKPTKEEMLYCDKCLNMSVTELNVRRKLYDIMAEASKPIQYGGDLYNEPEVYHPNEEDVLNAILDSGLIKLNLEEK